MLAGLLAVERKAAEYLAHPGRKAPHLDEPGADGKVDAGAEQQEEQQQLFVPQHVVHRIDDGVQRLFHCDSLSCSKVPTGFQEVCYHIRAQLSTPQGQTGRANGKSLPVLHGLHGF